MEHIVYFSNKDDELNNIINGIQTIILRAGESRKIPHSRVFKGDTLFFASKKDNVIEYKAEVKEVHNYNKLYNGEIKKTIDLFKGKLCYDDNKLEQLNKKCLCFIEFENITKIDKINIKPQAPMIDWIITEDINCIIKK